MTSFWKGFEKQAVALQAVKSGLKTGLGKMRTFGKGALVGAGLTGAGVSIAQSMAKTPAMQPAPQQGY